ncbi:WXG100 family type VII secretion target [Streptomyces sp. NPDC005526]|uniref:WXG100 family type VII secretion target n=1 Tax=Streptomyces sp. NPDC005526 TaxID=3156885 RepID=UPI00339FD41D
MSYRPTDWHILDLDRDPTPGNPHRIKQLARKLNDFAEDVAEALRDLKGLAKEEEILSWAGRTADRFAEEFADAPKKLRKLKKSYDLAGDALASFWPDLEHAQEKADKALRDGRKARADLSTAHTALSGANDWVRTATEEADSYDPHRNGGKDVPEPDEAEVRRATRNARHAKARQAAAQQDVQSAQSALEAAKKLADQAKGLREEAARRTVTKLREASDAGIPNRHWWEDVTDWVSGHWDEIVTVCKWVVTIVGIIVMIVGGPLGWLVFAAALAVLADTIRNMLNGQAGWGDLLFAALDCIPATKGFTSIAKLGKLWKAGGLRGLGAGFMKGISGGLLKQARQLRSGEGLRAVYRPFKGSTRLFGGTIPYRALSPKARQLAKALTNGPVHIAPNEVAISHMAELQKFHGVEHAVAQNPAGELRLFQGDEVTTVIPRELRDDGYKFTVHTHPEDRLPGPPDDLEAARGMKNSMSRDLENKHTPHVEAVISRDGNVRFFDNNGVLDLPQGSYPSNGPISDRGAIIPVPAL